MLIGPFCLSSYQIGPDSYLLQVKDPGFPARLREYLGVARTTSREFRDVTVRNCPHHEKYHNPLMKKFHAKSASLL